MKKILVVCLAFALAGCATTLVKEPQVDAVKKIAIVSIYANADVHDVKAPKNTQTSVSFLKAMLGKKSDKSLESNEQVQIVTYGLQAYGEELNKVANWEVVPPKEVLASSKYKALMNKESAQSSMGAFLKALEEAAKERWVTPPDMPYIPVSSLSGGSVKKVTVVDGKKVDPIQDARDKMAQLCKELGVDAVAVIGLDLAYKTGMLSGMKGTGLFSGVRGKATPMVASEIVLVTKEGKLAVESSLLSQGGGTYYNSGSAPMMLQGKPDLKDGKGECVEVYDQAVKMSAEGLRAEIEKELNVSK